MAKLRPNSAFGGFPENGPVMTMIFQQAARDDLPGTKSISMSLRRSLTPGLWMISLVMWILCSHQIQRSRKTPSQAMCLLPI